MVNFIIFIYQIIKFALDIYSLLIIISAFLSWIPSMQNSKFGRFIGRVVDPYIGAIERFIPTISGISFAPVVGIFIIYVAQTYILPNFVLFIWSLLS
ncbi:YggT family protein [Holzapfeliella sp. He02]|uniref:YggT family protein n=1 Tax=Holzapfeliella saturejae TaxID=3082953 RepID=A0ABU8SG14_9LACO